MKVKSNISKGGEQVIDHIFNYVKKRMVYALTLAFDLISTSSIKKGKR